MAYRRDGAKIAKLLRTAENSAVIALAPLKIHAPLRFTSLKLGEVGVQTYMYGLLAVIDESDSYAVINVNALMKLSPEQTKKVLVDDTEYYEFSFSKGSIVFETLELVKRENLMFSVFDEFIFKGKVPWYVGYEDLGKLFDTALKHAGSDIGKNPEIIEFLASMVGRYPKDKTKYLRLALKSQADMSTSPVEYVPLSSVMYSANSTLNKIAGSYFNEGVTSALVRPTDQVNPIEKILRA